MTTLVARIALHKIPKSLRRALSRAPEPCVSDVARQRRACSSAFAARYRQHVRCRDRGEPRRGRRGLQHLVAQAKQAASRGAVVAGTERQPRLYLDAELVGRTFGAVMPAVHDEPPGADGDRVLQRVLTQSFASTVEADVCATSAARGDCRPIFAGSRFLPALAQIHRDVPSQWAAPVSLERCRSLPSPRKTLGKKNAHLRFLRLFRLRRSASWRGWVLGVIVEVHQSVRPLL